MQARAVEQLRGIAHALAAEDRIDAAARILAHELPDRRVAAQVRLEREEFLLLAVEQLVQRGLFHVQINEQDVFVPPRHGQRQIHGHGALALVLEQRGDQDRPALRAAHQVIHPRAQALERLDEGKARRRVRDEDARFAVAQRFLLLLMAHGRKQARVKLLLHVRLALDRVAQIHAHRQIHGRQQQPRKPAELCRVHGAGAVGRCSRHRRPAQHIERHVAEELIGLLVIVAQDALRDAVRIALRGRGDRHRQ